MESLLFSVNWASFKRRFEPDVTSLTQVNVVAHASATQESMNSHRLYLHNRIFRACAPPDTKTNANLMPYGSNRMAGKQSHYRLNSARATGHKPRIAYCEAGKAFCFGGGAIIRAGRHTHPHAIWGTLEFFFLFTKLANPEHPSKWLSAIQAPNMVVSGKLKHLISPDIVSDPSCTKTPKFPGIQIAVPDHLNSTPELYLKQSTFIVPGVTSPAQLAEILDCVVALYKKYRLPALASAESTTAAHNGEQYAHGAAHPIKRPRASRRGASPTAAAAAAARKL